MKAPSNKPKTTKKKVPLAVLLITDPRRLLPAKTEQRRDDRREFDRTLKTGVRTKARQMEIDHRRAQVAALVRSGARYRDIALTLDVSIATVSRDVDAVRRLWREEAVHDLDVARQIDLQRLDRMWLSIDESVNKGSLKHIYMGLKILARRAAMFGYDKPKEIHVKTDTVIQIMNIVGPVVMARIERAKDDEEVETILLAEARKDPRLMDVIDEVVAGAA